MTNDEIKEMIKGLIERDTEEYFKKRGASAEIVNVVYNNPATIVFWSDNTKTVVKCQDEEFDPEKGLAMAICKKAFGNRSRYYTIMKEWLPIEYVLCEDEK